MRHPFEKFGTVEEVIMKGKYAFIDYREIKDAEAAVIAMNESNFKGHQIVVQHVKKDSRGGGRKDAPRGGASGPQPNDQCWKCGGRGHWANECGPRASRRGTRYEDRGAVGRRQERSHSRDRRRSPPPYARRRRDSRSDSREMERREGRCFICNERGHRAADCT